MKMNAVLEMGGLSAGVLDARESRLVRQFELMVSAPDAVRRLRILVRALAVRGKLVAQDRRDEPAAACLERIRKEREREKSTPRAAALSRSTNSGAEADFDPLPDGWTWARIGDIAQSRLGKMLDNAKNSGRQYPYLRNTNVQWGRFELEDLKLIRLESHELDEYRLRAGDLLVCEGGEPGRCAIWPEGTPAMYFQKALHRIRPDGGVSAAYLAICFRHDAESGRLSQHFTGATIKHLSGQELERYTIALPPVAEQARIVVRVDELMRLCDAFEQKLTTIRDLQVRLADALVHDAVHAQS